MQLHDGDIIVVYVRYYFQTASFIQSILFRRMVSQIMSLSMNSSTRSVLLKQMGQKTSKYKIWLIIWSGVQKSTRVVLNVPLSKVCLSFVDLNFLLPCSKYTDEARRDGRWYHSGGVSDTIPSFPSAWLKNNHEPWNSHQMSKLSLHHGL